MKKNYFFKMMFCALALFVGANVSAQTPNAWINEIHYDNAGTDVNEMIEVVVENPANYVLSDFIVCLYNGKGGVVYDSKTLSDYTEGATYGNYTVYYRYYTSSIQNGDPDGMALGYNGSLIQFLSYEGSFVATDSIANGVTSTDIGVAEGSSTSVGESLQLSGTGSQYSDFSWQSPATATPGAKNNNQEFGPVSAVHNAHAGLVDVYTKPGYVMINHAAVGEEITIYNALGQILVNTKAKEGLNELPVQNQGVVIVKVGSKMVKLVM